MGAKENELSIKVGDIVVIRTCNISGWCYAQNLKGEMGYIPFAYIVPFFPSDEYEPEWKQLVTLRKNVNPQGRLVPSIRKELVLAQRRSRLVAQNTERPIHYRYSTMP